jgi:hypothetical protein
MEEVPFDDRSVPRVEVDWERSLWWWYPLTRAIHPAMRMNALALGLVAVLVASLGVRLGEWLFQPAWQRGWELTPISTTGPAWQIVDWFSLFAQAHLSFERVRLQELAFITFEVLWLTLTFALFGGLLARRSLVELGQRTVAAWGESGRIVCSRWQSYLWSTGMHLVGTAAMLVPVLILGWLSRFGFVGATIAGVLLLLCFPLVFAIGRLALGAVVCFPFSVCAISAERKADAFEGFSRSHAYLFQRPVVAALCVVSLIAIGKVGELVVFWTITLGWWLVRGAYFFTGGSVQPGSNTYVAAGNWLAVALIAAYWFSFFWSASAATYLVLRKSVDNTELEELDAIENPLQRSLPSIPTTPVTHSEPNDPPAASEAPAAD